MSTYYYVQRPGRQVADVVFSDAGPITADELLALAGCSEGAHLACARTSKELPGDGVVPPASRVGCNEHSWWTSRDCMQERRQRLLDDSIAVRHASEHLEPPLR